MSSERAENGRAPGQRLAGKVAFITGTGGGQGRVAALTFAAHGARIVGCDLPVKEPEQNETMELVLAAGGQMTVALHDLGDPDGAKEWIEDGIAETGGIDILYNNGSLMTLGPIGEIDPKDWAFTLRNELDLVMWATQAAWPHLIARGGGAIINTSSLAGTRGNAITPLSAHSAAKGGVTALTRQMAAEGAKHNIRVNSISPGVIETPPMRAYVKSGELPPFPLPLGRTGQAKDIVNAALFFASDEANWVTGQELVVDGGMCIIDGVPPTPWETVLAEL
jgi:NAD(P)-dependent dehydrogenase (short-subunit alcohol dehydrogenase family)